MIKMEIKIEDIIFWFLILSIIAVVLWMLSGSPPMENGLLIMVVFVAGSELLIWKAFFKMDKKTAIGFEKMKNDMSNKFLETNNNLNEIKQLIKK